MSRSSASSTTRRHPCPPPTISVAIAVLASLSTLAGHSFILLVNGVHGLSFVVALLMGSLLIAVLALIQGVTFWLSAGPITGRLPPLTDATATVLASTAPLAVGVLVLIPHLGILMGRILQGWQAVCPWLLGWCPDRVRPTPVPGGAGARVDVISIVGVRSDDPGLDGIEQLVHLSGGRDRVQWLGTLAFPGR